MIFAGLQKTSLIDYPDRVATVLFTSGCNLRCPYCHNGELVHSYTGPFIEEDEVLETLLERKNYVDSVVVTGGEPTIHPDLPGFLARLKENGFNVKLDTNGFNPDTLRACLPFVDYIAMDVKTSTEKYTDLEASNIEPLTKSIKIIKTSGVDYEFRCTAVPGFVETETINEIGKLVKGAKRFVFQQFRPEKTLDPNYNGVKPHSEEYIRELGRVIGQCVDEIYYKI
ncbi:MAG: anaerobic ribonucleoside-triphosphate reductase activating protein [Candidatus Bathyarchaeota archaeon]|nr:anaerobic ribonucleoside-triphosphate reductase activating protein [Candidatus Bathyarchaeota archaeon]